MAPIFVLGVLALGAFAFRKKSAPKSTVDAMIDPSELYSPNAANARFQIASAVASNNPVLIRATAAVIEDGLKMPKTGANLRAWATMVPGGAVAGEIGAAPAAIPDWLKFQATQSKLTGDPAHIRATAETMKRFGYRRAAEIHLGQL
jgi:hypothetical protein